MVGRSVKPNRMKFESSLSHGLVSTIILVNEVQIESSGKRYEHMTYLGEPRPPVKGLSEDCVGSSPAAFTSGLEL